MAKHIIHWFQTQLSSCEMKVEWKNEKKKDKPRYTPPVKIKCISRSASTYPCRTDGQLKVCHLSYRGAHGEARLGSCQKRLYCMFSCIAGCPLWELHNCRQMASKPNFQIFAHFMDNRNFADTHWLSETDLNRNFTRNMWLKNAAEYTKIIKYLIF